MCLSAIGRSFWIPSRGGWDARQNLVRARPELAGAARSPQPQQNRARESLRSALIGSYMVTAFIDPSKAKARRRNLKVNARYLHSARVPLYCQRIMHKNPFSQSMQSWLVVMQFLDCTDHI